jgi:adenosylhomocysteine nucleosidase
MKRVAIIAAMAGELKPLVKGWKQESRNGVRLWSRKNEEGEWVAACAGAGTEAATRALAEVEAGGEISIVISTGWAGSLNERIEPGQAYWLSWVIDVRTGERFRAAASPQERWLITSPVVANAQEKRRLAAAYNASLVDMEAAAVARLAQMRGIPFYCIKGVSDGYRDQLPDFNSFISAKGHFMLARFMVFALLHPRHWPALHRMGENSRKAARQIADLLLNFLDEPGWSRERNG